MTVRGASTKKGRASAAEELDERVTLELSKSEADLLRFLRGQKHQPDQDVMLDNLTSMMALVMDDDLLEALKTTERHYLYYNELQEFLDGDAIKGVLPQRDLICQLERYQKSRLRDALAHTLRPSDC